MSDTPRTDEAILDPEVVHQDNHSEGWVSIDFAHQLERELNAAKGGIANLHKQFEDVSADIDRLDDVYTKLAAANERVKRLEEAVEILVAFGNQLGDELDPPDRNCSCHILPPCQDCEQWDSQRVAKSDWANAVERANKAKETKP